MSNDNLMVFCIFQPLSIPLRPYLRLDSFPRVHPLDKEVHLILLQLYAFKWFLIFAS